MHILDDMFENRQLAMTVQPTALFIVEEAEIKDLSGIRKKFTSLSVSPVTYTTLYDPTSFRWDFGDGSPIYETTDRVTYHTYNTEGTYLVKHQACNFCSCSDWNVCPQSITVTAEPNITSTSIDIDTSLCYQPCTIIATVTWTNNGNATDTFEPAITIDGTRTGSGTTISLDPTDSHTETITISNLMIGIHAICPDPN